MVDPVKDEESNVNKVAGSLTATRKTGRLITNDSINIFITILYFSKQEKSPLYYAIM